MADRLRIEVLLSAIDKATKPFRNVAGSAAATATAVKKSREALKALNDQQRGISHFHSMRTQLRGVSRELEEVRALSASTAPVIDTMRASQGELTGKVKAARVALKVIGAEMAKSRTPTIALTSAYIDQKKELAKLESNHSRLNRDLSEAVRKMRGREQAAVKLAQREGELSARLEEARVKMEKAGVSTAQMAGRQRALRGELKQATAQIMRQEQATARLQKMQAMAGKMTRGGMLATAHGAGFYAGGAMALQRMGAATAPGVQLQSQVRDIAITGGFNRQQEAALSAQIRGDAVKFGQTTDVISQGLQVLVANGVSAADDLRYYSGLLAKSSVASGAEVEDLSNLMVSLQQNLGLTREQMPGAIDALAYAGKQGSFELRDMAKWMPQLTPMMASLGVTGRDAVNQLGAALQVAKLGAGSTDEAGNNLKNFLAKIVAPETLKSFDKAGINLKARLLELQVKGVSPLEGSLQLITEYMGKKGPQAVKELRAAMALKDGEERQQALLRVSEAYALGELFRDQQAAAFIRPALANAGKLSGIRQGAAGAGGVLDADYQQRMDTAQKKLDLFRIKLTELKLKAFDAMAPSLGKLAEKAGALFDRIGAFVTANPVLSSWIMKAVGGFALLMTAAGAVLVPLGLLASAAGHLMSAWATLSPVLSGVGIAAGSLATPLLLIAGAGLLIWKFWEPIKAFFGGMWEGFLAGLQPVMPMLDMLGDTLKQLLAPAEASKSTLAGIAYVGKGIGTVLGWVISAVVVPLGVLLKGIAIALQWAGTQIGNFIGFIVSSVGPTSTMLKGLFNLDGAQIIAGLLAIWENVNQFFGGLPAKLGAIGANMVQGLVDGIRSMLGAPGKAFADIADGAIARFKNLLGIKSPSRVFAALGGHTMAGFTQGLLGGEGGAQAALGRIGVGLRKAGAGLALGTLGAGTAMAANIDARPPLSPRMAAGAAAAAPHYEIHIHAAPGMDPQAVARAVAAELDRREHARRTDIRARLSDID